MFKHAENLRDDLIGVDNILREQITGDRRFHLRMMLLRELREKWNILRGQGSGADYKVNHNYQTFAKPKDHAMAAAFKKKVRKEYNERREQNAMSDQEFRATAGGGFSGSGGYGSYNIETPSSVYGSVPNPNSYRPPAPPATNAPRNNKSGKENKKKSDFVLLKNISFFCCCVNLPLSFP